MIRSWNILMTRIMEHCDDTVTASVNLSILDNHMNGIIRVAFCVLVLTLSITFSTLIHVVASVTTLFLHTKDWLRSTSQSHFLY